MFYSMAFIQMYYDYAHRKIIKANTNKIRSNFNFIG